MMTQYQQIPYLTRSTETNLDKENKHKHADALLSPQDTAEILGNTPGTLSVWRSTGRYNLPFVKVGKSVKYRRSDVMRFIECRTCYGHVDALKPTDSNQ